MSFPQKSPREKLLTPVQFLKGVGPQRAELLVRLGLKTAADVLFYFPRDYQDASRLLPIAELVDDEMASVCGTVEEIDLHNTGPGRSYLGVLIRDDTEHLRAIWFNQPFMRQKFFNGQRVLLSGTVKIAGLRPEMHHPRVEQLAAGEDPRGGRIEPVYSLTEGLPQPQMRKIVRIVVDECASLLEESFPAEFLAAHRLAPIEQAVRDIHAPADEAALAVARRRFVYQELLVLQLALAVRKRTLTTQYRAPQLPATGLIDARIRARLPFALTADQEQAVRQVTADMAGTVPMNRLLHGEVGSGKTAVAVYAMLVAVANGQQAAVMAPTEILAQQHWDTLNALLNPTASSRSRETSGDSRTLTSSATAPSRVRLALLTGSLTAAQRRGTLSAIAAGEVDIVVGTHAVVQDDVQFARLGLVVIDEQHKFGVKQRAKLRTADRGTGLATCSSNTPKEQGRAGESAALGEVPHVLIMTATPIPRTMAMTLFGDLEVSTLRNAPPGRQTVHTYVIHNGDAHLDNIDDPASSRERWWKFFREKLRAGRQGYVIAPLVDDSPAAEVASVQATFENLANGELADFRLELLHGRMSAAEKDAAMRSFRDGDTQVLVATSVVEVGIDVPNATLMTIEDGQRFGLAQLHQLRGRISRGEQPGFVCVFASTDKQDTIKRLDAFAATNDGFELAEIDFGLRGPGDLLGTRQHGLPPLRIADLAHDADILVEARSDAQAIVADDALWHGAEFARLREMVLKRYGEALDLGDVG